MPSQTRRSSRLRSSAAKKIQKRFRSRKRQRSKASRKIQSRVRGKQTRKVINREKNTVLTINDCPICLEPLTTDVRIALPCGHRFHEECIKRSLTSTGGRCPKCRAVVTNIPYISNERQIQPPPLPPPQYILDPIQRRQLLDLEPQQLIQHLIVRNQELDVIEESIARQRELLPDAPEIPNITYEQAVVNEVTANDIETTLRSLYNEAYTLYTNYESFNTQDRPSTNDEIAEQYIDAFFNRTSNLLEVANYDAINALRISNHLG
uniref:RING-type domain-containing protein n=1 Tax=viral metagenome TaxID=1070528 RepID=A0A6C0DXR6_9ZZZZ